MRGVIVVRVWKLVFYRVVLFLLVFFKGKFLIEFLRCLLIIEFRFVRVGGVRNLYFSKFFWEFGID